MPILLTTPWDPGSRDPGKIYNEIKVVEFDMLLGSEEIKVTCQYGNTTSGIFQEGLEAPQYHYIRNVSSGIDTQHYDDMVAQLPETSETIYEAAAREIYQWLIDESFYPGTIV